MKEKSSSFFLFSIYFSVCSFGKGHCGFLVLYFPISEGVIACFTNDYNGQNRPLPNLAHSMLFYTFLCVTYRNIRAIHSHFK